MISVTEFGGVFGLVLQKYRGGDKVSRNIFSAATHVCYKATDCKRGEAMPLLNLPRFLFFFFRFFTNPLCLCCLLHQVKTSSSSVLNHSTAK